MERYVIRHNKGGKFNTMSGKHYEHVSYGYNDKGSPARFFASFPYTDEDVEDFLFVQRELAKLKDKEISSDVK